jgi:hypothetical protein
MKTLESLVGRHNRWNLGGISKAFSSAHIPDWQEMAFHSIVYKTEEGLVTLEAFLDSKSVFGTTIFESVCKAAEVHGVEQSVVRWIHAMLGRQ